MHIPEKQMPRDPRATSPRDGDRLAYALEVINHPDPNATAKAAETALDLARGAGSGPLRERYIADAQELIRQLDPRRQARTIQNLQGAVLALQGRGGDTEIAHVTPEELVIPKRMQSPELMTILARAAQQAGIDPRCLRVGSGRRNPKTGHEEFFGEADGSSPQQEEILVSAHRDPRNPTLDPGRYYLGEGGIPHGSGSQTYQDTKDFLGSTYTGAVNAIAPKWAEKLKFAGVGPEDARRKAFEFIPEYTPQTEIGRDY